MLVFQTLALLLSISSVSLFAEEPTAPEKEALPVAITEKKEGCPTGVDPRIGAYEIGLTYGALFPSGMVGSDQALPTLGLILGAPLLKHTLQAQLNYGSSQNVQVFIVELDMRWNFDSPFLSNYFLTGAHYLTQQGSGSTPKGALGITAGLGLAFALGTQMAVHLDLKGYVQSRTTILVSGGFSVLL